MSAAIAGEEPAVVPGTGVIYGASGHKGSIGCIYKTADGRWHAVPFDGEPSVHEGPMARWDASHALTLAHMRALG